MSERRPQIYINEVIYIIYILKVHSLSKDQTPHRVESDNIFYCLLMPHQRQRAEKGNCLKYTKKTTVVWLWLRRLGCITRVKNHNLHFQEDPRINKNTFTLCTWSNIINQHLSFKHDNLLLTRFYGKSIWQRIVHPQADALVTQLFFAAQMQKT